MSSAFNDVYFPHIFFFYQYYYSVRVFAGQELGGIWVGWITPDYHQYDLHFDINKVRNVTVTVGDDKGNIHDRYCILLLQTEKVECFNLE